MIKRTTLLFAGIMLTATMPFAAGDLIVDGNIGVGAPSPAQKAEIKSSIIGYPATSGISQNGVLRLSQIYGSAIIDFGIAPTGDSWIQAGSSLDLSNYKKLLINPNGGNVGIGITNPEYKLHIFGGDLVVGNDNVKAIYSYNSAGSMIGTLSNHQTAFYTNYNIRMVIDQTGNVGIGTTALNPDAKLDVAGAVYGYVVNAPSVKLTSDARFKKNLLPITSPIDKVLNLTGLSYEWKTDEYKDKGFSKGRHYGVIAQEIEKVLPEVVNTDSKGEKSVAYTEIIPVLIEAIKEQQKEIRELKDMNNQQQKQLSELRQMISK